MDKLPFIEASDLIEYITVSDTYQDVVTIAGLKAGASFDRYAGGYSNPVRINQLVIVMVIGGTARISIDYIPYNISANHLLMIMPTHIIQMAESSDDLNTKVLIISKNLMDDYHMNTPTPKLTAYMQLRKYPCIPLAPEETAHVENCFRMLTEKIHLRTHAFHHEVMQNSVVAFILELGNILIGKTETFTSSVLSRKEEIMNQFLQLLFLHVSSQHLVTFYADKLCITPQYLSIILKEITGKPANKWIDDALIIEAKVRLKAPQTTVQQVADALNFSDQSTFGKFFKKYTGLSPRDYRKS
ncbi:MAG: helix-turn-helix domain-containing protein [Tannerellaceae bacterium]|jgi:AraC-like DNA-binding protein|nr:helix-turn-helix domain-containing protein [Tannerellaceae bacterium]